MRIKYTLFGTSLLLAVGGILSFTNSEFKELSIGELNQHNLNSTGSTAGRTGAPGESNCTSCHSGSVQDGSSLVEVNFTNGETSFLPNQTYDLSLDFTGGAAKNGFQITVLDNNNSKAGTLSSVDNTTSISNAQNREYLNHTFNGNTQSSWDFQWTAPSIATTDVTFYIAANKTNSSGTNSGDVIYTHSISFSQDATAGIFEIVENEINFSAGYSSELNSLNVNLDAKESNNAFVSLVNLKGQVVYQKDLGELFKGENNLNLPLPIDLDKGIYVVHFILGNNSSSEKIYISK